MRHLRLCLLFSFALSLPLAMGCGADKGPGKPVADKDKLQKYLDENPDQNKDVEDDELENDDE